jgi:hypothetical protein
MPYNGVCGKCDRNERRWNSRYGKPVNLRHIKYAAYNYDIKVPSHLVTGYRYFIKRYLPTASPHDSIPRRWVTATVFAFQGDIEFGQQYGTYLLYLAHPRGQDHLRDSRKKRAKLFQQLQEFVYQVDGKSYRLFRELLMLGEQYFESLVILSKRPQTKVNN